MLIADNEQHEIEVNEQEGPLGPTSYDLSVILNPDVPWNNPWCQRCPMRGHAETPCLCRGDVECC